MKHDFRFLLVGLLAYSLAAQAAGGGASGGGSGGSSAGSSGGGAKSGGSGGKSGTSSSKPSSHPYPGGSAHSGGTVGVSGGDGGGGMNGAGGGGSARASNPNSSPSYRETVWLIQKRYENVDPDSLMPAPEPGAPSHRSPSATGLEGVDSPDGANAVSVPSSSQPSVEQIKQVLNDEVLKGELTPDEIALFLETMDLASGPSAVMRDVTRRESPLARGEDGAPVPAEASEAGQKAPSPAGETSAEMVYPSTGAVTAAGASQDIDSIFSRASAEQLGWVPQSAPQAKASQEEDSTPGPSAPSASASAVNSDGRSWMAGFVAGMVRAFGFLGVPFRQIASLGGKRTASVSSASSPRLASGVSFFDEGERNSGAGYWARAILGWVAWILFFRLSILFVRQFRRSRGTANTLRRGRE